MAQTIHYVADTENNVPKDTLYADTENGTKEDDLPWTHQIFPEEDPSGAREIEAHNKTRVWGWGLCKGDRYATEDDVTVGPDLESFFDHVKLLKGGKIVVWFHNLAYDGHLLLSHLMSMGYKRSTLGDPITPEEHEALTTSGLAVSSPEYQKMFKEIDGRARGGWRKPKAGEFTATISDQGTWYSIKVTFPHGNRTVEFRDSLKILPFTVDAVSKALKTKAKKLIGEIDYQKFRPVGYEMTDSEQAYIVNDVLVMAEAVGMLEGDESGILDNLTIGSACMKQYYKSLGGGNVKKGKDTFRSMFPVLDPELDKELRRSYSGGFCYVKAGHEVVDLRGTGKTGTVYDVNSLYPSVMYDHRYPVGDPIVTDPDSFDFYRHSWEYIVKVSVDFTVKVDHIPFIQVKNSIWQDNEHLRSSEGPIELTFTRPMYELFLEQYDASYLRPLAFWRFDHVTNAFDDYIEHWYAIKNNAKDPVERLRAKLMLNNLYGKMAQGTVRNGGRPVMDEGGVLRFEVVEGSAEGGYIPAGAYITAYAKAIMVRAAQANYKDFLYCDTDSYHGIGHPTNIPIGDELGQWDFEGEWDMARYVRQKTYIERLVTKGGKPLDRPEIDIKAAGAPRAVKTRLMYKVSDFKDGGWTHFKLPELFCELLAKRRTDDEIFERFTYGVVEGGKLRRSAVPGGPILTTTTFSIHPLDGMVMDEDTGLYRIA